MLFCVVEKFANIVASQNASLAETLRYIETELWMMAAYGYDVKDAHSGGSLEQRLSLSIRDC
jgi:hypothetical protein